MREILVVFFSCLMLFGVAGSSFDRAERAADSLVAQRQYASSRGIKCFPE